MKNLPDDFNFTKYKKVWSYNASPVYSKQIQIDILALPKEKGYSIIGEVKNRDTKKFSLQEAREFYDKMRSVREIERLDRTVGFVFSREGFTRGARDYLIKNSIAYTNDKRWLEK